MIVRYTTAQRIKMVEMMILTKNASHVAREFDGDPKPRRQTVTSVTDKFYKTGSVLDDIEESGRPRLRNELYDEIVEESIRKVPRIGLRPRSYALGIPRTTLARIIEDIGYRPFRPHLLIDLTDEQKQARVAFCDLFLERVQADPQFLPHLWFSDECRFSLDRTVNTHNCVYYATENPYYDIRITHTHRSLMVWCAISSKGIIGPYFFDENVTSESYMAMLTAFFLPAARRLDRPHLVRLQQDGASPHTALVTREFLNRELPNRWVGLNGPVTWPPKSPDLTPPDFFLWGYLKTKVYESNHSTPCALRAAIEAAVADIDVELCKKVVESVPERLRECKTLHGEQVRS